MSVTDNTKDDIPFVIKWNEVDESKPPPKYIETLRKGIRIPGMDDIVDPPTSYDGFDSELLRRGREILDQQHILLIYPFFLLVAVTTYIPSLFRANYYSGKNPSNTPHFCYKRLIKTGMDALSWAQTGILNKESVGYKNMRKARFLHRAYIRRFNKTQREYYDERFANDNLENLSKEEEASVKLLALIEKDLSTQVRAPIIPLGPPEDPEALYVNQVDMLLVSAIALGFYLSKGSLFGIDTIEKKNAVNYFFRIMNYSVGIQDEFNFAIGDVEQVQQNLSDIFVYIMGPHIRSPNIQIRRYFGTTVKSFMSDIYAPFGDLSSYLLMGEFLQVELPSVWAISRWYHRLFFHAFFFLHSLMSRNWLAKKIGESIFKAYQNIYDNDRIRFH